MPRNPSAVYVLGLLACLAVVLIFAIPPSSQVLIPAAAYAWKTGWYPDGLPLRRSYTGFVPLDLVFMVYGGVFGAAMDGNDEATHRFCIWFLPQLCTLLVFTYWEAGRSRSGLAKSPTLVCILAQLLTAGVVLPSYFVSHILNVPLIPASLPSQVYTRARTIFPAVALGYLVPSWLLMFPPRGTSLDGIQIISAIWQPFPIYIAVAWSFLRNLDAYILPSSASSKKDVPSSVLLWIKRSYYACGLLSAGAHLAVLLPSLSTSIPSHSFANVFVPFWIHPYLPIILPSESLADYRPCSRLLFQHDWLIMTIAAVIFFARSHALAGSKASSVSFVGWTIRMIMITVLGGPGAATAWAAIKREEIIISTHGPKQA